MYFLKIYSMIMKIIESGVYMETSRQLVLDTLANKNEGRAPRQQWTLPWVEMNYPGIAAQLQTEYPDDIVTANGFFKETPKTTGNAYETGEFVDEWGCHFTNASRGIIGEVKQALVAEEDWSDTQNIHMPEEWLTITPEKINEFCATTDKFVMAGCCPRPFEQLQFIRTTELLYMDLVEPPKGLMDFISKMHDLYCRQVEAWAKTDVDGIMMMDDWGSQRSLLINPETWIAIFKPMYKDYIDIAHRYGKKMFMHSDGYTMQIIPHLIELGLDAFNTQIFCMSIEELAQFKGQITFWGEIDRQHLLPNGSVQDIEEAVKRVHKNLWNNGGCIAQCEFSAGAKPENVRTVYKTWNELTK